MYVTEALHIITGRYGTLRNIYGVLRDVMGRYGTLQKRCRLLQNRYGKYRLCLSL